ncbi:MAG: hypothetical protein H0T92_09310, partial [Pyrinomonadaceae bacterium]|nr:hypothetical protein [Pyrinomonadaceae bacterium]
MRKQSFPNDYSHADSNGWLAFELSVLRRLKFDSIANPFAGALNLDTHLKRWGVRVATNDAWQWASTKAVASVENNIEQLTEAEVESILEDAYVPGHRLRNEALLRWLSEPEAWWFDNVRSNIERLHGRIKRSLALTLGLAVGDYAFSFDEETRHLRQPLTRVFRRIWEALPPPIDNSQQNTSTNKEAREFIAEQHTDLLFLRTPSPVHSGSSHARRASPLAWREEWVRDGDNFWYEFERAQIGRLGAPVESKHQYLRFIEELLEAASHLPAWAIAHTEHGFVST